MKVPEVRTDLSEMRCFKCNKVGHTAIYCLLPKLVCFNCSERGYISRECGKQKLDITCFKCGKGGTMARECFKTHVVQAKSSVAQMDQFTPNMKYF